MGYPILMLDTDETGYFQLLGGPGDGLIIDDEPITLRGRPCMLENYMWKHSKDRGVEGTTYYKYKRTDEFVDGVRIYNFIEPWIPDGENSDDANG